MDESLLRLFLGCALFRLGGEMILDAEQIDEIRRVTPGFQMFVTAENKIILRSKDMDSCVKAVQEGNIL